MTGNLHPAKLTHSFLRTLMVTDFSYPGSHPCPLVNTNWVRGWQDTSSGTSEDPEESLRKGQWGGGGKTGKDNKHQAFEGQEK